MESHCTSSGCPRAPEYVCKCQDPPNYLCESHLSWHIGSKRKSEHRAMRLETLKPTDYKDCNICMKKSGQWLCLCRYPGVKLCNKCYDLHVVQSSGKHTREPIDALDFIHEESDIPKYMERKEMVDSILKIIHENSKEAEEKQNILKIAASKMMEKLKKFVDDKNTRIDYLKKQLKKLEEDVRNCKFKKNLENNWLEPFFKDREWQKIFRAVRIDIQDDTFDTYISGVCKIETEVNLLKNIENPREERDQEENKDASGMFQKIQSCYSDSGRYMHIKLKSLFESALQPSRIEKILSIELSNCMLENNGSRCLAQLLPALPQLKSLNLNSNNIGPYGVKELCPSFVYLRSLETLMLSWNKIEVRGMEALSEVLPEMTNIRNLHLSWNSLDFQGAKFLSTALPNLERLERLDLWNNQLGEEGVRFLVLSLPFLKSLKVLDLNKNEIGPQGADLLALVLPRLTELHTLSLAGNNIGPEGITNLSRSITQAKKLQVIDLARNGLTGRGAMTLMPAFQGLSRATTVIIKDNQLSVDDRRSLTREASVNGINLS